MLKSARCHEKAKGGADERSVYPVRQAQKPMGPGILAVKERKPKKKKAKISRGGRTAGPKKERDPQRSDRGGKN